MRTDSIQIKGRRLLSVKQAACYLGLAEKTIHNGTGRKAKKPFPIKFKRYGRRILFDIRDLEKFVDELEA